MDAAALFDDSTLWHDPAVAAPGLADLRYPTGGRPLVKVWRAAGSARAGDRPPAATSSGSATGPRPTDAADRARRPDRRRHRHAAHRARRRRRPPPADAGPRYDLPWPATVPDPADDRRPAARRTTTPPTTRSCPSPTTRTSRTCCATSPDEDAGDPRTGRGGPSVGRSTGCAACPRRRSPTSTTPCSAPRPTSPCCSASGPRRGCARSPPVAPDPNLVPARRPPWPARSARSTRCSGDWNLDHRRVNEWRTIVAGGAAAEAAPPADAELADGARVADAMGWVPLWRAWLRVATDTQQDAGATTCRPTRRSSGPPTARRSARRTRSSRRRPLPAGLAA